MGKSEGASLTSGVSAGESGGDRAAVRGGEGGVSGYAAGQIPTKTIAFLGLNADLGSRIQKAQSQTG